VGVTLATCGVLVYSIHGLFFFNKEIPKDLVSTPSESESVASPVVVEELVQDSEIEPKNITEAVVDPEVARAQAQAEQFKFVKYEIDYKHSFKTTTRTLTDFVAPERLQLILREIETSRVILRKYSKNFVKGNEDFIRDADKIYRRFVRAKDEVSSFSHEERFGDWHYASSVLDQHENSITILMLALINKPTEYIGLETEALWDYEVWRKYMFKCHKNFYGAADSLNYAEQLIQMYLSRPDCFTKIEPVWVVEETIVNKPILKVIPQWDEIFKDIDRKKSLLVRTEEATIVSSNTENGSIDKIAVLEQPESVPNLDVLETVEQPLSLLTGYFKTLSLFTKYLISYFW